MRVWSSLPPERFILKAYVGWLDEDYEAANTLQQIAFSIYGD